MESNLLAGIQQVQALRIERGEAVQRSELLAEETPVALVYNGISHAVMMASPLDLEDFALGFSLTEGIIAQPRELTDIEVQTSSAGISIEMRITEERFRQLKHVRRTLAGRTGCGLCGQDSLEAAIRPITPASSAVSANLTVDSASVQRALQALTVLQPLNAATGAVHAAGWWRGEEMWVREDVGRHNALDKLIGATARHVPPEGRDGLLVMTSRASYEIVHKAAAAGFVIVATISAPTALAVRLADEAGMTLIGFARDERMTVYSHAGRMTA
ncbi:formate dehydrogenase accessory sulfurtransferase FdhD [Andreprevotia chitinilytica]|uniref:formate dehydrogenase accessory sulfurtransferase FdhD n=1 Tax=Andreprevotia chitinilytica TaxID=396808 RepID=UPI0005531177